MAIALVRWSDALVALPIILAISWGAAPHVLAVLSKRETQDFEQKKKSTGTVTLAVHLDGQPPEISRASILAAATEGSTVVLATEAEAVEALGPLDVPTFVDATLTEALHRAVQEIDTDAVLVMASSSFADRTAVAAASGLIRGNVGWVTGRERTFNLDGYAPDARNELGRRLRADARTAGAVLWEPNATIVSTQLLRSSAPDPAKPWGASLRALRTNGYVGIQHTGTLAVSAVPVDARSYWHAAVIRRRAAVADLVDAAVKQRGAPRWAAVGLALRELYAFPFAIWLLSPLLIAVSGTFPFRSPPWAFVALLGVVSVGRWAAVRWQHGFALQPLHDTLAAAYGAPASALALPSAFTRRVKRTRLGLPPQILTWAAVAFGAVALMSVLRSEQRDTTTLAVAVGLVQLCLLWAFGVRAVFQRNWTRTSYRVLAQLPVRLNGHVASTVDVSPSGVAVRGHLGDIACGAGVQLEIDLDDGTKLAAEAEVADRRRSGDLDIVGLAMRVGVEDEGRWIRQLARAGEASAAIGPEVLHRAVRSRPPRTASLPVRALSQIALAFVALLSASAVAVLCLLLFGYRPLVVRSGSMAPALTVGDVVIVKQVPAGQVSLGEIVTFPDPSDPRHTLTHRVQSVATTGEITVIGTRGDANVMGESWSGPTNGTVGRVVRRVPNIGRFVAWATTTWVRAVLAGVGLALAAVAVLQNRVRRLAV